MTPSPLMPLRHRPPLMPTLLTAVAASVLASVCGLLLWLALLGSAGATAHPVLSDSMLPTFARGDLVVTKPASTIVVGDMVTFRKYGRLVTHRVVALGRAPGTFETRGDANPGNDPWTITRADITGRVQGVVRRAGTPLLVLESAPGRILGANLLVLLGVVLWWGMPRATRIPPQLLHPSAGYAIP